VIDSIVTGLTGLTSGVVHLATHGGPNVVMLAIASVLAAGRWAVSSSPAARQAPPML